ncbi:hypothetical protein PpBr36_03853 [Pyricularia pennisetigena]|uniref:hypothetical protein n=1 Tax=Pyricularia pennisetigena TaxID=1578925 RepID=UPI00114FF5DD|nr:hypothetical protein PpBr36_03853 [Pyricularia pennisetigena]TLS30961.1 hypothetical protein PpBr36_03853 [Pyricularia pennisetigena]
MKTAVLLSHFTFALFAGVVAARQQPVVPKSMYIGTAVSPGSIYTQKGFPIPDYPFHSTISMTSNFESAKTLAFKERDVIKAQDAYVYFINTKGLQNSLSDVHSTFHREHEPSRTYDKGQWMSVSPIPLNNIQRISVLKRNGRTVIMTRQDMETAASNKVDLSSPYFGEPLVWPLDLSRNQKVAKTKEGSSDGHVAIQID